MPYRLATPLYHKNVIINGVKGGTRTHDLQGHNLALYQLSYIHHVGSPLMARLEGLEPPTYALEGRCSIQLSYRRICGRLLIFLYSAI